MKKIVAVMLAVFALNACASRSAERPETAPSPSPVRAKSAAAPEPDAPQLFGQTIYVPVYSHIYFRDKNRTINLTATLSIRNTDAQNRLRITAVRYYDTNGKLVRTYLNEPLLLAPMASTDFVVDEEDTSGGVGANFIVELTAEQMVTEPVVEAVMISTASGQGISFVSAGRVIAQRKPDAASPQ